MQSRLVRATLIATVSALGALVLAVPASAGHYPTQHDPQMLSVEDADASLETSLPGRAGFECEGGFAGPYPCENVDLASAVPLPEFGLGTGNDIWGWTDPQTGREYAIMGTALSTGFVDVTDPEHPEVVGELPTAGIPDFVLWRDIKVDGNYAFVVSEVTGHGMQVFDADANYRGMDDSGEVLSNTHNISINEETDTAYLVGTNTCSNGEESGGLHMVDISDPLNPRFAGCATVDDADGDEPLVDDVLNPDEDPETESNNYVHDVECVIYGGPDADHQGREICFGSNENAVVIYDVTDRSSPQVLSQTTYPTAAYTHQGSLTEDQEHFIFGDELDEGVASSGGGGTVDETTTYIMRAADLDSPEAPKAHGHGTTAIDHNLYVHGNRAFQSNYTAGLRITEFDDQSLNAGELREVGFFDVFPAGDPNDFAGTWSNYRFDSGTTVVSSIENQVSGLFVLRPQLGDDEAGGEDPPGEGGRPDGRGRPEGRGGPADSGRP